MKKIFTLVAVAAMAIAANAQTSDGVVTFSTLVDKTLTDGALAAATINGEGTLKGSIAISDALTATAIQSTYKDKTGASCSFGDGVGYIKFVPTATESLSSGTADTPADYSAYIDFTVEEGDITKTFGDNITVEFDATRLGTDAVRLQAEILSEGDGTETTGYILTSDNWQDYANGESWAMYASTEGGEKDTPYTVGWTPIREDLSKATNTAGSEIPYNHVTIKSPKLTSGAYKATLRVYVTGIANNKGFMIENVKFSFGSAVAVKTVNASAAASNAVVKTNKGIVKNGVTYNFAGQRIK